MAIQHLEKNELPTSKVSVGTTEVILVEPNDLRSAFIVTNPDSSAILYISDESGKGTIGIPLFPKTTLLLSRCEGVQVEKQFYIISDTAAKEAHVMTFYQTREEQLPPPTEGVKADPPMG